MNKIVQTDIDCLKAEVALRGFSVAENVFSQKEIDNIISAMDAATKTGANFRSNAGLFAIRQILKEVPSVAPLVFTEGFLSFIAQLLGDDYFVVKSIYFDKPPESNWFVSFHQDLTISVNEKADVPGFRGWTTKYGQFSVQPPIAVLKNVTTLRIHFDDTNEKNGALHVIPGSHSKGILRPELVTHQEEAIETCTLKRGSVMIMKPLLLHASSKTTNNERRRVIHIEFSSLHLPEPLNWVEYMALPTKANS